MAATYEQLINEAREIRDASVPESVTAQQLGDTLENNAEYTRQQTVGVKNYVETELMRVKESVNNQIDVQNAQLSEAIAEQDEKLAQEITKQNEKLDQEIAKQNEEISKMPSKEDLNKAKDTNVIFVSGDENVGGAPEYSINKQKKGLQVQGANGIKTFTSKDLTGSAHGLIIDGSELKKAVEDNSGKLSELDPFSCKEIEEDGVYFVDSGLNIGFSLNENEYNAFKALLEGGGGSGSANIIEVEENGFFLVDSSLFVGYKFDGGEDAANFSFDPSSTNLQSTNIHDAVVEVNDKLDVLTFDNTVKLGDNPIAKITYAAGLTTIIRSWGFIGDSLCSGSFDQGRERYEQSWGQHICRLCGAEGYNYSKNGQSAEGWVKDTNERGWGGLKNHGAHQAYIIAMGANGSGTGNAATDIGTYDKTTDTDTNAATFAGYYAGIIQRIKSLNSQSVVFCVTLPVMAPYYSDSKNKIIKEVAGKFGKTYVIDLQKYAPSYAKQEFKDLYVYGYHLTAAGYLYTAYMFMQYIDWIIRNNPTDFNDIANWIN